MSSDLLLNHLLIGPPASGKTTFAQSLQQELGAAVILSTDRIREQLYGDAAIQGPWEEIEAELQRQIQQAVADGKAIIYDATNVKRAWRMGFLQQVSPLGLPWIAWELKTDLNTCKAWNQHRQRVVPERVIEDFYRYQQHLRPTLGEGFVGLASFNPTQDTNPAAVIQAQLKKCRRSGINHENRYAKTETHRYSRLLDFDRLMHLLALLSRYPGLGQLRDQDPATLEQLLTTSPAPVFVDAVAEIAAVLRAQQGPLYGDEAAIALDLQWLEAEGFLGSDVVTQDLRLPPLAQPDPPLFFHHYSDRAPFSRLVKTIRFILHNPLIQEEVYQEQRSFGLSPRRIDILASQLEQASILYQTEQGMLRKDIEWVLHPYGIFPEPSLRKGYYLGTGILNRSQLEQIYQLVQKQADGLDDPLATETFRTLEARLQWARFNPATLYPVRSISRGSIVSTDLLSRESLATATAGSAVETDIRNAQKIRIGRIAGAARFKQHDDLRQNEEEIWPLQIVFHNIAWYLAYEVASGPRQGLFCYERLDRLYRIQPVGKPRSQTEQKAALEAITTLQQHGYGLFLGDAVKPQQTFLLQTPAARLRSMDTLELRFTESLFAFISEGTQRFPLAQMKMSRPPGRKLASASPELQKLYSLPKAPDPTHPYQLKVKLPAWSLQEITLKTWLLGLRSGVKVIAPKKLRDDICQDHLAAAALYGDD
ncbi:AAA family ATPase [Synechococcus elongatus]|uniref:AAA family ATPase n=1 Tax=Synechococcus elongatus PCC 11802 TaxID=2283154 RepID=A0AAT9JVY8_SYNEL|nr:AAA family ATPase [Synechococcus elongatus]QFZ92216.1 WYL domain-containing protein [Synechococcus elongatus PCC 11802]